MLGEIMRREKTGGKVKTGKSRRKGPPTICVREETWNKRRSATSCVSGPKERRGPTEMEKGEQPPPTEGRANTPPPRKISHACRSGSASILATSPSRSAAPISAFWAKLGERERKSCMCAFEDVWANPIRHVTSVNVFDKKNWISLCVVLIWWVPTQTTSCLTRDDCSAEMNSIHDLQQSARFDKHTTPQKVFLEKNKKNTNTRHAWG